MTLVEVINLVRAQGHRVGRPGVLPTDVQLVLLRLADDLEHRGIDQPAATVGSGHSL